MLSPDIWLVREIITIFLVLLFAQPAHTLSDKFWGWLLRKRKLREKISSIALFQLNFTMLIIFALVALTLGVWLVFNY